jgi:hypothetical protein
VERLRGVYNYIDLVPGHYPTEASTQDDMDNVDKPPQPASFPASLPHEHEPDVGVSPVPGAPPELAAESPDVSTSPTEVPDVSASLDESAESPELSKGPEPSSEGSKYGPIHRVHGKAGPQTLHRPPAMRQDDFVDMVREIVPHMLEQTSDTAMTNSASTASGSGQKRSHDVSAEESEPAASRPRSLATEALSVADINPLFESWDQRPNIEVLVANYMQKKQSKEIAPTGHSTDVQKVVDDSKAVEWQTLIEKGALKLHYGKKAQQLKVKYPERFMGGRFVMTRKPLEENQHVNEHDPSV